MTAVVDTQGSALGNVSHSLRQGAGKLFNLPLNAVRRLTASCDRVKNYFVQGEEKRAAAAYRIGHDVGTAARRAGHWLRYEFPTIAKREIPWAIPCAALTLAMKASLVGSGVMASGGMAGFAASLAVGAVTTTAFRAVRERMTADAAYRNMPAARQGSLASHMWRGTKLTALFTAHAAGAILRDGLFFQKGFYKKVAVNMAFGGGIASVMQLTGASAMMGHAVQGGATKLFNFLIGNAHGSELDGLTYGPGSSYQPQAGHSASSVVPEPAPKAAPIERAAPVPEAQPKPAATETQHATRNRPAARDLRGSGTQKPEYQDAGRVRAQYRGSGQPRTSGSLPSTRVAAAPERYDLKAPMKLESVAAKGGSAAPATRIVATAAPASASAPASPPPPAATPAVPPASPQPVAQSQPAPGPDASKSAPPRVVAVCNVSAATGVHGITNPVNVCSPLPDTLGAGEAIQINYPDNTGIPASAFTMTGESPRAGYLAKLSEVLGTGNRFVAKFNEVSAGLRAAAARMIPRPEGRRLAFGG